MILRGSFFSPTLEMQTGISVLVPNAALSSGSHKVVYLLHGLCGSNGDWLDYTMLPVFAEKYDAAFVMPEVARSFYSDMAFGQRFYRYVVDELPRVSQSVFNLSGRREDTLVIGASMGGYGALKCALSNLERYGACAAFSSACLFLKEGLANQRRLGKTPEFERMYGRQLLNDFESIFGPELEWKPESDIVELARRAASREPKPRVYLACGTEDAFHADHGRFVTELKKTSLDFTYQEWKGSHDWNFFNAALEKSLEHLLGTRS